MSQIDKLSILGIRSFDNASPEAIQFHSPLTLIVGYNGSGKTTIIESLKYATTGNPPPMNKNSMAAFIHDPKLCGEKEVLAQIKISFRSTEGVRMIATRSMQVTVKKNANPSFKTLEGNLTMSKDGDKTSISTKQIDLNQYVPNYLGVSVAILENVIFCHQEESLWPLGPPADLKIKFDAIFEAVKYTKAIDSIKALRKRKRDALAVFLEQEKTAKVEKDRGQRMEKQAAILYDDIQAIIAEREEILAREKEAADMADEASEKMGVANQIVGTLNGKRIERDAKEESVKSLREHLTEMEDSDADLQRKLEQFENQVQTLEDDIGSQKSQYGDINREIEQTRQSINAKTRECGSLEAQQENYERQIEVREQLIKKTAHAHNIRGFDLEINDTQVQAFMERISKMAKEQNAVLEKSRREIKDELNAAQQVITNIRDKQQDLNSRKESSRSDISKNDAKITSLQSTLGKITVDEGGKATMEANLQDTEARLNSAKQEMQGSNREEQVSVVESELRQLEERSEKLQSELVEGTRQAGDSARLDYVQKELKVRQQSLGTMVGAHGNKIGTIVGQDWAPASIETAFEQAVAEKQSFVAESEKQRDGTGQELAQLDYKLNTCRSDLKAKQQTLKTAAQKIMEVLECEPENYEEEIKQMEQDRDNYKSETDSFARVIQYFDACEKIAKEHKRCKTCMRGLESKKEVDTLFATLAEERKKFQFGNDVAQQLKDLDKILSDAKALSSDYETWERLKHKEIPALLEQDKTLSAKRERLVAQLEDQDSTVSERQAAKRDVDAMGRTIQTIAKYATEISSFETQIEELSAKQKAAGLSRGLEIIQEDIKQLNEKTRNSKSRLAKLTGDRDRAVALINSLELEFRDIKSKVTQAEYQLKEKKSLDDQIEDLRSLNTEHREKVKSIERDLQELGPQRSQAQMKYDDIAQRGEAKDRELQNATNKLSNSVHEVKTASQEIEAYIAKGGPEALKRGRREAEKLQEDVVRLEKDLGQLVRQINGLEGQLRNLSETKRNISDNQRFRRDLHALQRVRTEIEELEQHNAEEDKRQYLAEADKWKKERSLLSAKEATLSGELKSKDEELKRSMKEYDQEYKGAARRYKEAHVKVETCKACVEDLGRYSGALDKAIMKYHSIKMEEINRIIDELWRKTYQGTDVDTILIRSESDTGNTKKNYNYRVCMVKSDVEMDMRGRCSAGQKVLASIIIRLALAECFGTNCGLIALDEPTTNLDRDNIRALAESLAEIIKVRRAQKNFQLIVITHDEEFLRTMNCSDFADVYYRVGRNERQKSEISRQSIAEVM